MMIDGVSSRPFSAVTLPPMDIGLNNQREKIVKVSRERYANQRKEVEDRISKWSGMMPGDDEYIKKDSVGSSVAADQDKSSVKKNKTTCWSCGEGTEVSFEPDGRRPIYCKDCLEKVKAGEDLALRFRPTKPVEQSKTERVNQQAALGELGIEFEGSSFSKPKPEPKLESKPKVESKPEPLSTVSLNDAVKNEPVSFRGRKKRVEVDLKDLRKTLEEAMNKKD